MTDGLNSWPVSVFHGRPAIHSFRGFFLSVCAKNRDRTKKVLFFRQGGGEYSGTDFFRLLLAVRGFFFRPRPPSSIFEKATFVILCLSRESALENCQLTRNPVV